MSDLICQSQVLTTTLLKTILGIEHDSEVLTAGVKYGTVGSHQVFAIKLEDDIKEMIKISALDHLSMNDVVLFFYTVFRRLYHSCIVELVEVKLDSLEQLLYTLIKLLPLLESKITHRTSHDSIILIQACLLLH